MGAIMQDRVARTLEKFDDEESTLSEMVQRMTGAVVVRGEDGADVPQYEGLPAICRAWDVPYGRVMEWLVSDAKRYAVYERALQFQAKALVGETLTLADDANEDKSALVKAKLQIETRFRIAKYHDAGTYGDKGAGGGGISVVINRGVGNPTAGVDTALTVSSGGQEVTVL